MKLNGRTLKRKNRACVRFQRGDGDDKETIELIVSPLPLGWMDRMFALGVFYMGDARQIPLRDSAGKVQVNPETGQVETVDDPEDHKHIKKTNDSNKRFRVLRFVEHVRETPGLEFETAEPSLKGKDREEQSKEWTRYADGLEQEILAAGFTDKEVNEVISVGDGIACITSIDTEVKRFLPALGPDNGQKDEESSSQSLDESGQPTLITHSA